MNAVFLVGRLTRAPELRYTPNQVAVGSFTLAVDRDYANQDGEREADFIPVVVWRGLAETCAKHLQKGRLVAVHGRLQIRSWEDKDGERRWKAEVVADRVRFLDWGKKWKENEETEVASDVARGVPDAEETVPF